MKGYPPNCYMTTFTPHDQAMNSREHEDENVDQFLVYAAYGEVMHQFQILELTLWGFKASSIKPGTNLEQGIQKVGKWDGTTLGNLIRGLKSQPHWPTDINEELEGALQTRNYLAHHFLREYALVKPNKTATEEAAQQLANVSVRLAKLIETLEEHQSALAIPNTGELDEETRDEIEQLRPDQWFSEPKFD